MPVSKVSRGSSSRLRMRSQARPNGWTTTRAMIGVIATLGYRSEKNRFVADPTKAHNMARVHMRGAERALVSPEDPQGMELTANRQSRIVCWGD